MSARTSFRAANGLERGAGFTGMGWFALLLRVALRGVCAEQVSSRLRWALRLSMAAAVSGAVLIAGCGGGDGIPDSVIAGGLETDQASAADRQTDYAVCAEERSFSTQECGTSPSAVLAALSEGKSFMEDATNADAEVAAPPHESMANAAPAAVASRHGGSVALINVPPILSTKRSTRISLADL